MSSWQDLKNNPRLKKIYEVRCEIIRLTREFFWSQGFVETDTPIALKYPSQEPYLNFFPITVKHPSGDTHQMHLRTSPEFSLKKILAAGFTKVFEIGRCFRNEEAFGGSHNPEFTLLEWYRAPGDYTDFMDDMENLFKYVGSKLDIKILRLPARVATPASMPSAKPMAARQSVAGGKDYKINVDQPWERVSMKDLWQKYAGVNLDDNLTIEQLKGTVREKGYQVNEGEAYEDLFFKIFLNEIEGKLGLDKPTFVCDYPAQMASLSRLCGHDPRYAERVECYIGGLEMCNGFGELTDAKEQKIRLEKDRDLRGKLGKPVWPVDPGFIAALESGIPANDGRPSARFGAAAGVALGLDRMVVLFTGANDINEVIFGSVADQIE